MPGLMGRPGSVPSCIMVRLPRLNEACADRRAVLRIRGSASGEADSGKDPGGLSVDQPKWADKCVQSTNYWSTSAHAENPALMWGVGFGNGGVLGLSKAFDQRAWCVRGGMKAD